MSNWFNKSPVADDTEDVKIIINGSDNKFNPGANNVYAFCNHCKKDISVVYIKSAEANGKEVAVTETMKSSWPQYVKEGGYPENDYDKCMKNNDYKSCKKLLDEKKKTDKIHELWLTFLNSCTLHGFHFCFSGNPPLRRVIWSLLLLGAFALFVEKCKTSIDSFFQYPFTTTTVIVYESSMVFPAVSICNYNDARLSKMNGTLVHKLFVCSQSAGKNCSHLKKDVTGEVMKQTLSKAAHRLDEMILDCHWGKKAGDGIPCSHNDFVEFRNAHEDVCFTFNSGKNGTRGFTTTNTGEENGLRLLIDTQHHDYYYDVESAGFKVILHDQAETPSKMQGYAVSPGFTTYMELRKRKVTNLPHPYRTNCGMPELRFFDSYSKSKCFLDRLTVYVVGMCGCRAWFMPGGDEGIPVCDFAVSESCLWPAWKHFEVNKLDKCPVACESVDFSAQLSYSRYPANTYGDLLAKERNMTGTVYENRQHLRDNLLELKIYFESLTYSEVKQVPSYDLFSLLGDVGGQIGLFLGASLLTIVEYLDLCAMVLFTKYKYRKN